MKGAELTIDLKKCKGSCFAYLSIADACKILIQKEESCNTYMCPFYKPKDCKDWVRIKDGQGTSLVPFEEYIKYRGKNER